MAKKKLTKEEKKKREADKRARLHKVEAETRRKQLAAVGIDARTAQGQRQLDIVSMGATLRVSINHFAKCFPKRYDRTDARLLAWSEFDAHWAKATAGMIATPSMEPGVDGTSSAGVNIAASRLDALAADRVLKVWLSPFGHDLLIKVIAEGHTFEEVESLLGRKGFGQKGIAEVFAHVLDRAAVYFDVDDKFVPSAARQTIETAFDAIVRQQQVQPFSHAEARRMVLEDGASVRDVQQRFNVSYRFAYSVVGDIKGTVNPTLTAWNRGRK